MGLNELVRSNGYKQFMAKLYGWGASVVILGALFKIMHFPGAGPMLIAGMGTEALIFFMSAFEPLHVDYNWALVYPELAVGDDIPESSKGKDKAKKNLPQGTPTQQLDKMLEEAKIGPELIESLATGMRNLSENAKKLSGVSDVATVTDNYVGNLTKAAESVRNLTLQYDKVASSLTSDTNGYTAQVDKLNQNLASINSLYELQLQHSKAMADNYKAAQESLAAFAKNVSSLNSVYGNMLAAMNLGK